jgi:hypothetical protein
MAVKRYAFNPLFIETWIVSETGLELLKTFNPLFIETLSATAKDFEFDLSFQSSFYRDLIRHGPLLMLYCSFNPLFIETYTLTIHIVAQGSYLTFSTDPLPEHTQPMEKFKGHLKNVRGKVYISSLSSASR